MIFDLHYQNWFSKLVSILIDAFFVLAAVSSLYVFTSFLSGFLKYCSFAIIILTYLLIIRFFKKRIRNGMMFVSKAIGRLDKKQMVLIIFAFAILMKIVYTALFSFDATQGGDISIYNEIADQIIATGELRSSAISHLFGMAVHIALMKLIGLPLHVGMFMAILAGTVINFLSFSSLVGKDKSFLCTMLFLLMPSTCFLSFCITHEIFVYLYFSVFLFLINRFLNCVDQKKSLLIALMMVADVILTCIVNPAGYVIYVIIILIVLLSNTDKYKKVILLIVLLLSILGSKAIDKMIDVNEYETTLNTYSILIHGSNIGSMGEQQDGFPHMMMREYLTDHNMEFNHDNFKIAAREVLLGQYRYLMMHPTDLIRLIVHKIYIQWSGVHYPIELAAVYHTVGGIFYYILLGLNTLIYLFVLTVEIVYGNRKKNDHIGVSNYKLAVLGVLAITMLSVVLNKYLLYITLFIYFVAFEKADLEDENG